MNFTFFAILAFYIVLCSSQPAANNGVSDYFYAKHVIDDVSVQRQLLSNIPDSQKKQILTDYLLKPFRARPDRSKAEKEERWKILLGSQSGTTYIILANRQEISSAVRLENGAVLERKDSNGRDVFKTKRTFPMIKAKINFVKDGSGSGPKKNVIVSFVKDDLPTIRYEQLMVSHLNGEINHFESANKG